MAFVLAFDPITLIVVLSFEGTILAFVWAIRGTTAPMYPVMGALGGLTTREAILLGRFLRRQLRGDGFTKGILQREEDRILEGLEPEVPE